MLKIGYPRRFINKAYIDLQISLPNRIRNVPNVNKISDTNYTCRTLVKNSSLNKKIINRQHLIEPNYTQLKLCSGTSNAQAAAVESQSYFRTQESDPRNHDERHLGRIYTMPGKRLMCFLLPKSELILFGPHFSTAKALSNIYLQLKMRNDWVLQRRGCPTLLFPKTSWSCNNFLASTHFSYVNQHWKL